MFQIILEQNCVAIEHFFCYLDIIHLLKHKKIVLKFAPHFAYQILIMLICHLYDGQLQG